MVVVEKLQSHVNGGQYNLNSDGTVGGRDITTYISIHIG